MLSKAKSTESIGKKTHNYASSGIVVVIAVGIAGAALAGMNAALVSRELIMSRARTAASAFSYEEIKQLSGSSKDLDNRTYQSLKKRLNRIRQDNPGTRFSYLVGIRSKGTFFYVDSEPVDSRDYSPPGQSYPEASPELLAAFDSDTSFIEGPSRDSYGTWLSALAPVTDTNTGKTVAMLGVDVPATAYYSQIALYALIPLLLAAIPLSVLIRNRRLEIKDRELTELRTQFVTIASHELRSPLTGTLWGVQSLLKSNKSAQLDPDQRQILKSIYNNTASSIATINEILDLSIFRRGDGNRFQKEPLNLVTVIKDTEKLFSLSAAEAGVKIKYIGDWPSKLTVLGDPNALKRAFSNIFSNAIKYSPSGGVIEIAHHQEHGYFIIGIRDHGIGIPKTEQQKVLGGYYRAANAARVKTHGTGMGLWVTKNIIKQHGGRLSLESKLQHGTTIFVRLPSTSKKDS